MRAAVFLVIASAVAAGCSSGTDLGNPEHARDWANSASALAVFVPAHEPLAVADGEMTFADPACPTVDDDGTTLVITGGCANADGRRWEGTATVVRGADGAYDVTLSGYGNADEGNDVARITGTFTVRSAGTDAHSFDADYTRDGLLTLDVDYAGTVTGGYDTATVWSGSGTVTRGGFTDASGTATATTADQRRDGEVCGSESVSGSTTIVLGERTLVIDYDGETDCSDDHTARWTVDGEDQGTLDGIVCAASPGRGQPWSLVAFGAAALWIVARRSRRRG